MLSTGLFGANSDLRAYFTPSGQYLPSQQVDNPYLTALEGPTKPSVLWVQQLVPRLLTRPRKHQRLSHRSNRSYPKGSCAFVNDIDLALCAVPMALLPCFSPTKLMSPFLSSLAAVLRARQTSSAHDHHNHVVALNLQQKPQTTIQPPPAQHPLVSFFIAYSLFLLGRANVDISRPPTRPPKHLSVKIDLLSPSDGVHAELLEGPPVHDVVDSETLVQLPTTQQIDLSHASDLRASSRHIAIVSTAAMPWMTGTAINPALRAAYLAKDGHHVTLVLPWLASHEQQLQVFSKGSPTFDTQQEQRHFIQTWLTTQVPDIVVDVLFYSAAYSNRYGSILPIGAITDVFTDTDTVTDVCILEEPEHLTWHHSGKIWTELFSIVVGIIHTNYIEYAKDFGFFGPQRAMALLFLNVWVCRGYCHKIIKLSDAVQEFPNSVTSNVHGVREKLISIGRNRSGSFPRGAYFMGKVLWAKGYRDIIDYMIDHFRTTEEALPIDFFGAGPDESEILAEVNSQPALSAVKFETRVADPTGEWLLGYKVFVNASRSDVICTASAEALAMGKFVVCLDHPSNDFFATFPNCRTFRNTSEFADAVKDALLREPTPLSGDDAYRLTWEAATERLYDAMRVPLSKRTPSKVGKALANTHAMLSKIYPQPGKGFQKASSKESLSQPISPP